MDYLINSDDVALLQRFRAFLDSLDVSGVVDEADKDMQESGPLGHRFLRELGEAGWLAAAWPGEEYGQSITEFQRWLLNEELEYRGLPNEIAVSTLGPTIARVGTEEQKQRFLPGILSGTYRFALGYTEPDAGSDLAALRTSATKSGDYYVVNGEKVYTTGAHHATHIWLAVRTDARSRGKEGLSVLVVDRERPGITIRPLWTQSGGRTNQVFFDGVRVPVENRIGADGQGWPIIKMALDFERILPFSRTTWYLERLLEWCRDTGLDKDPIVRQKLARIVVDEEVGRLMTARSAWELDHDGLSGSHASMVKVWVSELRQRLALVALSIIGSSAQLRSGVATSPAGGLFERMYRSSPMMKFAGGANEVQRTIIATSGLGLPRERRD